MRINFYGGPGVGKSTLAALTYAHLRQQGRHAELVQEWIKTWAYLGRRARSFDYVYTFANQLHEEDRLLQAGVEIITTDSPVYLQCMYASWHCVEATNELKQIADRFEAVYPSVNFLVQRPQFAAYEQAGRYEDLDQALRLDTFIEASLRRWHVPFTPVPPGELDTVLRALDKSSS